MFLKHLSTKTALILIGIIVMSLSGCSAMPITHSGFLTEKAVPYLSSKDSRVIVAWRVQDGAGITDNEKAILMEVLETQLQNNLSSVRSTSIQLRAAITRVETVSPALNVLSTALLLLPLDRGGAAVEFEALDSETHLVIQQFSFAEWIPMSELKVRFSRLDPAKLALVTAADEFSKKIVSSIK